MEDASNDCNISYENAIAAEEVIDNEKAIENAANGCNISPENAIVAEEVSANDKVLENAAKGCNISHENAIVADEHSDNEQVSQLDSNQQVQCTDGPASNPDFSPNDSFETTTCNKEEDMTIGRCQINQSQNRKRKVTERVGDANDTDIKESDSKKATQDVEVFSLYTRAKHDAILEDQFKDVWSKDSHGKTALDYARDQNDWKAYRVLVDAGCCEDIRLQQSLKIKELKICSLDEMTKEIVQIYEEAASDKSNLFQREDLANFVNIANSSDENAVSIAAEIGDLFTLEKLIHNGVVVNKTALVNAVSNHHAHCIARVLECNVVFDAELLKRILEIPFLVVLKVFLEAEKYSTPHAWQSQNMTIRTMDEPILHKAVRFENTEAVLCLIRAGADVHKCNHLNETALNIAVHIRDLDLIKGLLDSQLNESEKETVFLLSAVDTKYWNIFHKCIDEGVDLNCRDDMGRTALMISISSSSKVNFEALVRYNANINLSDIKGNTPLILASGTGDLQMVQQLLKSSESINCQNMEQKTALLVSIQKRSPSIVQELIKAGADVNLGDALGNSALSLACSIDDLAIVKALIEAGANINHKQKDGFSILHNSVICQNLPIVQFLLESGAEINAQNITGNTALSIACIQNSLDIIHILINAGANVNMTNNDQDTALLVACRKNCPAIVQLLLNAHADVNCKDASGDEPLIIACRQNALDMVRTLLFAQAKVDVQNKDGDTALMVACREQDESIVQTVLLAKADVNAQNANGDTSLILACQRNSLTIVRYLLIAGADVNVRNGSGNTAMTIADREGFQEICKLLNIAQANVNPETRSVDSQTTEQSDVDQGSATSE